MAEITVTRDNFDEEVLKSGIPVLVDFWASWCAPCRMLAPLVAEIAEENEGSIKVCKVNVDEQGELAMKYGISAIPAVIAFENGKVRDMSVGYVPKEKLLSLVK